MYVFADVPSGEDCLRLNVWTPGLSEEAKRPVMVWLHGGGFSVGNGSHPEYDGSRLARRGDVVVVTLNHRLNLFGYLYLAELGGDDFIDSGNAGQLDLIAALRWVRDNIREFGGDPDNVTLFGASGGGQKICALTAMPAAAGLFHRAIIQSGFLNYGVPRCLATENARYVLDWLGLGAGDLQALRQMPEDRLVQAFAAQMLEGRMHWFAPVVDGHHLVDDPFARPACDLSATIPMMVGSCRHETHPLLGQALPHAKSGPRNFELEWDDLPAALAPALRGWPADQIIQGFRDASPAATASEIFFAITNQIMFALPAHWLAERKAEQRAAPVFVYRLDWESPAHGGKYRAGHGIDVPLVFDNVANSPAKLGAPTPRTQAMADLMSQAWINFARSGDPSPAAGVAWPRYTMGDRKTMIFNDECRVADDPYFQERALVGLAPPRHTFMNK